eukprot:50251-Eustigmatos_ZCMA.PRE.1
MSLSKPAVDDEMCAAVGKLIIDSKKKTDSADADTETFDDSVNEILKKEAMRAKIEFYEAVLGELGFRVENKYHDFKGWSRGDTRREYTVEYEVKARGSVTVYADSHEEAVELVKEGGVDLTSAKFEEP